MVYMTRKENLKRLGYCLLVKIIGGVQVRRGNVLQMAQSGAMLNPYLGDGLELSEAKYVYDHWIELGAM